MMILALDVSTSIIGVCKYDTLNKERFNLDHIDLKKYKDVWQKADIVRDYFSRCDYKIDLLAVESIAKMFNMGASSADTIISLSRFNGLVSYLARDKFGVDPIHITPATARKSCGLKMLPKKKHPLGKSHKEQTADLMKASDLKLHTWPRKKVTKNNRSPDFVDWHFDEIDAYVIAKSASVLYGK